MGKLLQVDAGRLFGKAAATRFFVCLPISFIHIHLDGFYPSFSVRNNSSYSSAIPVSFRLCGRNVGLWDHSWIRLPGFMLAISYIRQEEIVSRAACLVINLSSGLYKQTC